MSSSRRNIKMEEDVNEIITIEDEESSDSDMTYEDEELTNEIEAVYLEEDVMRDDKDDSVVLFYTNADDGNTASENIPEVVANPTLDPISDKEVSSNNTSRDCKSTDRTEHSHLDSDPMDIKEEIFEISDSDDDINEDLLILETKEDSTAISNMECNICGKILDSKQGLEIHKIVHIGEQFYKCDVCAQVFISETQCKNHKRTHSVKKLFKCSKCRDSFWLKRELRAHLLTHRPVHYECTVCHKIYKQKSYLKIHMWFHNDEKNKQQFSDKKCKETECVVVKKETIQCQSNEETSYKCSLCGKQYSEEIKFKMHTTLHADETGFHCFICDKTFLSSRALNMHKIIHTGDVFYNCDVCDKVFISDLIFKEHKAQHQSEKHFCDVCNKVFAHKMKLIEHQELHMRIRTLNKCDKCGRSFKKKINLTKHQISCDIIKSYLCAVCDKEFSSRERLKDHMLNHSGKDAYKCYTAKNLVSEDKEIKIEIEDCMI